ncbi:MAG TPA: 4-(cytidine 5'-diphospho)-2-C-methyl-D-erythritol kinase [Chthoniobacterales bacterium]|jgi:4-diphosphocytidyl-2-C-methyl-D-erythritol kinase|nr:4-(cytidine 5'-diphospho)-2-C-methyl-D-erythritol kinase [Chthoniobacterales bacterium]
MQLFAPAKINLSFQIRGRRTDGFHEIETLMTPIALCDELTIEPDDLGAGLAFSSDDPSLPAGEDNLVVRAARSFFAEIHAEPAVRIALRKKIPHGAGLGGGSSDAASTLLGLNELHGRPLPSARLTSLAAGIGSDVPFFLAQGAARCRGRGEIVEPVSPPPELPLLLLKPEFGVPTSWAYAQWRDSREVPGVDYTPQRVGELSLQNDLERPVFEKYVFLARMKTWLRDQPEVGAALLSGSGSTIFAVLRAAEAAAALADRARIELDPGLWSCATSL